MSAHPAAPAILAEPFRVAVGKDIVAAVPVAYQQRGDGARVILRDTQDRLHVADVDPHGRCRHVVGPVTVQDALAAAERRMVGAPDHGSVAKLVNALSVALIALSIECDELRAPLVRVEPGPLAVEPGEPR